MIAMPKPPPQILTATELQQKSAQIIRRCCIGREHFIIERGGFPVVAIIPIDEYDQWIKQREVAAPNEHAQ